MYVENPVEQSVAIKQRGRPVKQTTVKLDDTVETASTSAEQSCGQRSAAKRGRCTKPMFTATINGNAVTLEELQKGDGGWFTIKPAVTIAALYWDRYSYHRCVECRMRALPNAEGKLWLRSTSRCARQRERGAVSPVVGRTLCTPAARVRLPG